MGTSGGVSGYTQTQSDARYYAPSLPADRGLVAYAYPIEQTTLGSTLSPAGTLFVVRCRRVPAGQISNVQVFVTAAGSGLTSGQCFGALWTAGGTLVGQTVDQAAAWASTGAKVMTLSSPYINPAVADLYAGFWYNGTTGPTLARIGGVSLNIGNYGLAAPNLAYATADTGLTTTAPASLGAQTAYFLHYWAGLG